MVLQCPHSLLSTAILPHSISPAPQTSFSGQSGLLSLSNGSESDKQMCINMHQLCSKKKHNVLHLSAMNADGWDLNGVFWCIILNCIIRNYGPYAMLLWQLRGHSHLHKHATGILMDWGRDGASTEILCSRSAHPTGLSVEITHFFWQPNIDAFAYRQVILNYIHQRQHTYLLSCAKQSPRQSSVEKRDWCIQYLSHSENFIN